MCITLLTHIFALHCSPLIRITNDCLVSVNEVMTTPLMSKLLKLWFDTQDKTLVVKLIGQLGHYMQVIDHLSVISHTYDVIHCEDLNVQVQVIHFTLKCPVEKSFTFGSFDMTLQRPLKNCDLAISSRCTKESRYCNVMAATFSKNEI